jgi:hypothetical protein
MRTAWAVSAFAPGTMGASEKQISFGMASASEMDVSVLEF